MGGEKNPNISRPLMLSGGCKGGIPCFPKSLWTAICWFSLCSTMSQHFSAETSAKLSVGHSSKVTCKYHQNETEVNTSQSANMIQGYIRHVLGSATMCFSFRTHVQVIGITSVFFVSTFMKDKHIFFSETLLLLAFFLLFSIKVHHIMLVYIFPSTTPLFIKFH